MHQNILGTLYEIVTEIYYDSAMKILIQDLFFFRIKQEIVCEQLNAVIKLEEQFIENMDQLEITKKTFDPKKC